MMPNTEGVSELVNEIDELKERLHEHGKALARIKYWSNTNAGPNTHQTLERVLSIFKEEVSDQLIKIRYSNDNERSEILKALSTVPGLEVDDRGFKG